MIRVATTCAQIDAAIEIANDAVAKGHEVNIILIPLLLSIIIISANTNINAIMHSLTNIIRLFTRGKGEEIQFNRPCFLAFSIENSGVLWRLFVRDVT
jgi:hypothetical protein